MVELRATADQGRAGDAAVALLAFLLAAVQFTLVGFGVTVVGTSELRNVAFGLALFAIGFVLPPAVAFVERGNPPI